jgi:hypothetical protein
LAIARKRLFLICGGLSEAGVAFCISRMAQWSNKRGWKTTLNNLRLIIQPTILFWMIIPWLEVFPNRSLLLGFHRLIAMMNQFSFYFPDG